MAPWSYFPNVRAVSQMTVEEKAMQVSCVFSPAVLGREGLMREQADTLLTQGIGHIAGPGPNDQRRGPRVLFNRDGRIMNSLTDSSGLPQPAMLTVQYGGGRILHSQWRATP